MKETFDIENILARLEREVYLNMENPSIKMKRQYHKASKALADARHEFSILNALKDGEKK